MAEYKFIADVMLGRLARWLKVSGLDVLYENPISHRDLIIKAAKEGRRILTKSSHIKDEHKNAPLDILITANHIEDQLRQFYTYYNDIDPYKNIFSRCLICNVLLIKAGKKDVSGKVPERVLKDIQEFHTCPKCGRAYWHGGHVTRMASFLKNTLKGIA